MSTGDHMCRGTHTTKAAGRDHRYDFSSFSIQVSVVVLIGATYPASLMTASDPEALLQIVGIAAASDHPEATFQLRS